MFSGCFLSFKKEKSRVGAIFQGQSGYRKRTLCVKALRFVFIITTPTALVPRVSLNCIQKNIRKWLGLKNWSWWRLYVKIKPLLNVAQAEDEMKIKEEELLKTKDAYEKMQKGQKDLEEQAAKLMQMKNDLVAQLQAEQDKAEDSDEKLESFMEQKVLLCKITV